MVLEGPDAEDAARKMRRELCRSPGDVDPRWQRCADWVKEQTDLSRKIPQLQRTDDWLREQSELSRRMSW